MTTQHAPQTPLWRRVLSLPHTRLGWWAVGLAGIASIDLVAYHFGFGDDSEYSSPWLGAAVAILLLITVLVAPLAGGVVGSLALGAGERSLLLWLAQVPAALFFAILGSIFQEGSPWVNGSPGVLIWAVIAMSIILFTIFYNRYVDPQDETEDSR